MEQIDVETVILKLAVQHQKEAKSFGIGITALNAANQGMAAWSLRERQTRNKDQDMAEIVRLCMIKAAWKGWEKINIRFENKKMMNQIQTGKGDNIEIAAIMEDIQKMTLWFRMCSFVSLNEDTYSLCYNLSKIALLNFCDME